ncbi:MAG: phosphatase PAP2 family protein [Treponema sp.]|nr:phosphatase PAP2 family protein [Treponema sp.]
MDAILQWGLRFVELVQGDRSPVLVFLMRGISAAGSAPAFMLLIAFLYWCVDDRKSVHLGIMLLISAWVNLILKLLLDQPRPFFPGFAPELGIAGADFGGMPSGHAQNSLVLCLILASWIRKTWFYALAGLFCLAMAFSRIYLGVHFPTDIVGGWLVAGLLALAYFLGFRPVEEFFANYSPRAPLVAVAALSFAMILYRPVPDILLPAGLILGLGLGFYLCRRHVAFVPFSTFGRIGLARHLTYFTRFTMGTAGLALLLFLPRGILARFEGSGNYNLLTFAHYALVGLWVTLGAPWLFRLTRLSESNVIHYEEYD